MSTSTNREASFSYPVLLKQMLGEFIGTFFLVLVACMTIVVANALSPLVIGLTLMVMVFSGGHISGGHFNPAVSLGVWSRRGISWLWMFLYIVIQCVAGLAATKTAGWLLPRDVMILPLVVSDWMHILLAELLGTFALVYTVLNVTVSRDTVNNSYYGLAIGITVTVMAFAFGSISGGIFNPALAGSMYLMGYIPKLHLLTYLAGDFAGAVLASLIFKLVDTNWE